MAPTRSTHCSRVRVIGLTAMQDTTAAAVSVACHGVGGIQRSWSGVPHRQHHGTTAVQNMIRFPSPLELWYTPSGFTSRRAGGATRHEYKSEEIILYSALMDTITSLPSIRRRDFVIRTCPSCWSRPEPPLLGLVGGWVGGWCLPSLSPLLIVFVGEACNTYCIRAMLCFIGLHHRLSR